MSTTSALGFVLSCVAAVAAKGPPPPPPPPPAGVSFNSTFSSYAVLQQAPAKAAVYGMAAQGSDPSSQSITITVDGSTETGEATRYTVPATMDGQGGWLAYLTPATAGGDYTITAACTKGCVNTTSAVLEHVTFGDVWYCAGQSNMWLPLFHTFSRNYTVGNITAGKYSNIRLMAGNSQSATTFPWMTAAQSIANGNTTVPDYTLFDFSGACWYFAEVLTNTLTEMKEKDASVTIPPIGLISTAIGGSMIEEWLPNATLTECKNLSIASHNEMLYDQKVLPYLKMTIKGWLWYQGENDMHIMKGNSLAGTGYACAMPTLISYWRKVWSAEPGTTDPNAPFGLVALPGSGSEGGPNMGAMNLAQTASYGVAPNPAMPNTFIAQAFDLNDPWGDKSCYGDACCWNNYNVTTCTARLQSQGLPPNACEPYCQVLQGTQVYMGGIHPRDKYPVGRRLALAAASLVYGASTPTTGPVLSGCALDGATSLTIKFNTSLLAGESVTVGPYNKTAGLSGAAVLTNASFFCMESLLRCQINATTGQRPPTCGSRDEEWYCSDSIDVTPDQLAVHAALLEKHTRLGGVPPRNPFDTAWITVDVLAGSSAGEVTLDVSSLNGSTPVGVRYGWQTQCCNDGNPAIGKSIPCAIEACPIMLSPSMLPPLPFMARVESGKCKCTPPQVCDA